MANLQPQQLPPRPPQPWTSLVAIVPGNMETPPLGAIFPHGPRNKIPDFLSYQIYKTETIQPTAPRCSIGSMAEGGVNNTPCYVPTPATTAVSSVPGSRLPRTLGSVLTVQVNQTETEPALLRIKPRKKQNQL
jgi:hypothetical protein